MSNFLSQLELNPQVGQNDEEDFEQADIEREKEIKKLIENELIDDFFEDDSSFTSHQTSLNDADTSPNHNQMYSVPNGGINKDMPLASINAPLLTSRGNNFIKKTNSKSHNRRDLVWRSDSHEELHDDIKLQIEPHQGNYGYEHYANKQNAFENEKLDNSFVNQATDSYQGTNQQQLLYQDHKRTSRYKSLGGESRDSINDHVDSFHQHFDNAGNGFEDKDVILDGDKNWYSNETDSSNNNNYIYSDSHVRDDHSHDFMDVSNYDQWPEIVRDQGAQETGVEIDKSVKENSQLHTLYDARGRKIEQLQRLLESRTEEQAKEMRILQHKLTLATGERDGISMTLQQSQDLLLEKESDIRDLRKQLSDEKRKNQEMQYNLKELNEKFEMSESTIDTLNQQLSSLNRADSLARMRSQHEVLMATSRQKHEEEILLLKEKLDDTKKELNWKTEDVNRLQDEIQTTKKYMDQQKVESADTVNKLTKTLEESQRQLREMLGNGYKTDIGEAEYLLKQSMKEKTRLEEENKELKDEIKDVKDQLGLYEVALNSTVDGPSASTPYNAYDAALKLHQFDAFKTPLSRFSKEQKLSPSLKDDLVKALASNKTKREELLKAKSEMESLKEKINDISDEKKRMLIINEALKTENEAYRSQSKNSEKIETNQNDDLLSELQSQLKSSDMMIKDLEKQLEDSKQDNANLRREISNMMHQFDKEKIEALKTCEKTYSKFNEDTKKHLEEALGRKNAEEEAKLRDEIKHLKNELLDVKDSYVSLANENKVLAEQVQAEQEKEAEQSLKELTNQLNEAHKEEIRRLEEHMSNENYSRIEELRKTLRDEFEEEAKHRMETAIALAKVEWFAIYEDDKLKSAQRAIENAKLKFDREKDSEREDLIKKLRQEWADEKQVEFETHLKNAREKWEEAARLETEKAIRDALDGLKQEFELQKQKDVEDAVSWAKQKNELQQQVLREESKRIRIELLRGFAEENQVVLTESAARSENTESDVYAELKETIAYVKSIYDTKLRSQRDEFEDRMKSSKESWTQEQNYLLEKRMTDTRSDIERKKNQEKDLAISKLNDKWEEQLEEFKEKEEEKYRSRFDGEIEKAKNEWRTELAELQKEHDLVLRNAISEMRSKADSEREKIEKECKESVRKLKKENSEKLEKQKVELEAYHNSLTKKTLNLARKEWELEFSNRSHKNSKSKSRRTFSESTHKHDQAQESQHLTSADSGFTSPLSRILPHLTTPLLRNSTEIDDSGAFRVENKSSPPYEALLTKFEAELNSIKESSQEVTVKHISTQTDQHGQDNSSALEEMRQYYLETVKKIKDDVTKHISKTKENASARIRKEVAKEKKTLIDQIRRKYLKNLKTEDAKRSTNRREVTILQILKEVDVDENEEPEKSKQRNDFVTKRSKMSTDTPSAINGLEQNQSSSQINNVLTQKNQELTTKPTAPVGRTRIAPMQKQGTKKDLSPNHSLFSCESNATFYTELPSTFMASPTPERNRKALAR